MQGSKSAKSHRDNCILKFGRSGDLESFKEIAEARSRVRRDRDKRSAGHFCPFYVNVLNVNDWRLLKSLYKQASLSREGVVSQKSAPVHEEQGSWAGFLPLRRGAFPSLPGKDGTSAL